MYKPTVRSGFTLIEILVVVAILSILAGVVTAYSLMGSAHSRDVKRQADLRALQSAIEQYKLDNGRYPERCASADAVWSGESGTDYACTDSKEMYIKNLAPRYIRALPKDPRRGDCPTNQCGYVYTTNAEGTVYKVMAMNTVESEVVTYAHPMKSCDITGQSNNDIRAAGMCGRLIENEALYSTITNVFAVAQSGHRCNARNTRFQKSYGVWGGFASLRATRGNNAWCLGSVICIDNEAAADVLGDDNIIRPNNNPPEPNANQRNIIRLRALFDTTNVICK